MIDRLAVLLTALGLLAVPCVATCENDFENLVEAAKRGDEHAVRLLLGEDPARSAARDAAGYTALHWAAIRGHWRIVVALLEVGAPVDVVGADGGTPLHWACHHDRADMVGLLLAAGADPAVHNQWGRTPLHVAARRGCVEVTRLLLDRGADPDAVTREGWTPLHVAHLSGQPEIVRLLEEAGADRDREDLDGRRPVDRERPRPREVAITPDRLDDYVGIYEIEPGATVKIWRERDTLGIREFAPDHLYPIADDSFFCRREPWRVTFRRAGDGSVDRLELEFLRDTVSARRLNRPLFVGSRSCIACHQGAARGHQDIAWLSSRHAHAYWRLRADWAVRLGRMRPQYHDLDEPAEDGRCLMCHTTGAHDPDSLFAASFRPEDGVGCEACHGPGSRYATTEIMADRQLFLENGGVVPGPTTCRHCHRAADRFDYATWWPKIAHPLPESAPAADPGEPSG